MRDGGNAKVREQHLLAPTQQHILRLDIAVDEFLLVGILQGISYLLDRQRRSPGEGPGYLWDNAVVRSHWGHSRSPERVHHPAHRNRGHG